MCESWLGGVLGYSADAIEQTGKREKRTGGSSKGEAAKHMEKQDTVQSRKHVTNAAAVAISHHFWHPWSPATNSVFKPGTVAREIKKQNTLQIMDDRVVSDSGNPGLAVCQESLTRTRSHVMLCKRG